MHRERELEGNITICSKIARTVSNNFLEYIDTESHCRVTAAGQQKAHIQQLIVYLCARAEACVRVSAAIREKIEKQYTPHSKRGNPRKDTKIVYAHSKWGYARENTEKLCTNSKRGYARDDTNTVCTTFQFSWRKPSSLVC
jgi:hypothetical protein